MQTLSLEAMIFPTLPFPYTERQEQLVAQTKTLAQKFAERAAQHDADGTFPLENYDDIRTAGLPGMIVPTEYGGQDANLLDMLLVMEMMAIGDGSTALSTSMHVQTLGNVVENRSWPSHMFDRVCRDAVAVGAMVNAVATEPELGSPSRGGKPKTTAHPVFDDAGKVQHWLINGHKNFASLSPTLDYMIIAAALEDGSGEVARFVVPTTERVGSDGAGIEVLETWNAMGMRSTGSHDVLFKDVSVQDENIIMRSDSSKPHKGGRSNPWFMLIVSGVYLGVAVAAQRAAAHYAQTRVPTALGKPIATLESIQRHLGEAELLLHQAHTHLYHTADQWIRYPDKRMEMSQSVNVAKHTATNNAIKVVDHCMRIAGGAGMTKNLPIERYYRDVRGGLTHPMNDDQLMTYLGRNVLGRLK
ncbi:MAG: acyl-CoA dehydrogenase family protein [Chloroflexota bacterium]